MSAQEDWGVFDGQKGRTVRPCRVLHVLPVVVSLPSNRVLGIGDNLTRRTFIWALQYPQSFGVRLLHSNQIRLRHSSPVRRANWQS